jgi:hypothetical protein
MRTKIKSTDWHRVTITFTRPYDDRPITYNLFAPIDGGYVRYEGTNSQICERLARTGDTLYWHGATPLVDLIRYEYKKMKRDFDREKMD